MNKISENTHLGERRSVGRLIDKAVKKAWSDEDVLKYVGRYKSAHLCYSPDKTIRKFSASGGSTTALLHSSLENGLVDGVVVCRAIIIDGKVRPDFFIATDLDQLKSAQGSKYVETKFLADVLPLIRGFDGRLAVIGLPCDISNLKRWQKKDAKIGDKVVFTVALVCGHNSRTELIDHVTGQLEKEVGSPLKDYKFRIGHWRGNIRAEFENGEVREPSTKRFNDYQNLFFFCERKCLACHDHYGYDADISVGDVWLYSLKSDPIKKTGIIVRTPIGETAFDMAVSSETIVQDPLDIRDIMDGQSRIGPSHYNTSARAKVSKLFGIKMKDTVAEKVKWHSYINAFVTLSNLRFSETKIGQKVIFLVPRKLWRMYLIFKKGLETLR